MLDYLQKIEGTLLPHRPLTDNALNIHSKSMRDDDFELPGTYKFWSNDTKERYEDNLTIQDFGWRYRTKEVEYNLNSAGYRCPEFDTIDWENSIVIFGCSQVFGTGLAEDKTIAGQLQNLVDCPVINLGKNGTSMVFALANNILFRRNFPTPRAVINHWTEPYRETYFGVDKIVQILPRQEVYYKKHFGMLVNMLGLTVEDVEHDYTFKAKMTSETCKAMWEQTTYIESTWNYLTALILECYKQDHLDSARDISTDGTNSAHSGVDTCRAIAKYYKEQLS